MPRPLFLSLAKRQKDSRKSLNARQAAEGHEIGNHTYRHHFRDGYSPVILKKELDKNAEVIKDLTGIKPSLFRPGRLQAFMIRKSSILRLMAAIRSFSGHGIRKLGTGAGREWQRLRRMSYPILVQAM
ncbi:polysaccharide deacetylase family protein [Mesobacillus sp.]|uniref:polysaccharide deacetylase family protein n=1 Tax=Mesobacillus sp. TaxID=2675271 RepID=UPI0039F0CEDB